MNAFVKWMGRHLSRPATPLERRWLMARITWHQMDQASAWFFVLAFIAGVMAAPAAFAALFGAPGAFVFTAAASLGSVYLALRMQHLILQMD